VSKITSLPRANQRTEKIKELFLAWVQSGLEHCVFAQLIRILFLEQDLLTCQPSAVIRVFHSTQPKHHTSNWLRQHFHHKWMFDTNDGISIGDSENFLLDKAESFVGGPSLEQLGDSRHLLT
jgi:hypothetical protein